MINAGIELSETETTFYLDLSGKPKLRIQTLSIPYRVVVDLLDVTFLKPIRKKRQGRGLVRAFRYGRFGPRVARIILYTRAPVKVELRYGRPGRRKSFSRLAIQMQPTNHSAYLAASTYVAPPPRRKSKKPLIIIDPGHGGIDPGAIGRAGTNEKDVVLSFSLDLKTQLMRTGRYDVRLTRPTDFFMKLRWRVYFAALQRVASLRSGLFISIHADSTPLVGGRSGVRGFSVYTHSDEGLDEEVRQLANAANPQVKSVDGPGIETHAQLPPAADAFDQRIRKRLSVSFAGRLLTALQDVTRLRWPSPREASFDILSIPDMPSVLLELGYLSNRSDEMLLASEVWRERVAGAVVAAIDGYFSERGIARPASAHRIPGNSAD